MNCIIDGKPLKRGAKKFCSRKCKAESQKGRVPWNKGLTVDDPRVKKGVDAMTATVQKQYDNGRKSWITGKTKETEPILQETAKLLSEITKKQYLEKGKEIWLKERPGFIRYGRKNGQKQKDVARQYAIKNIVSGKLYRAVNTPGEIVIKSIFTEFGFVEGKDFIYQCIIGPFVFDFCVKFRKVIECDEKGHRRSNKVKERDKIKEKFLKEKGYSLLRLSDIEILNDREATKAKIRKFLFDKNE